METAPREIRSQLVTGEKVLWWGQPRQGFFLRGADVWVIPFTIAWNGMVIHAICSAIAHGMPLPFFIPFVVGGLYMLVGRFYVDAAQRKGTYYAVTTRQVLFVKTIFGRRKISLDIAALPDFSYTQNRDGRGTIEFGHAFSVYPADSSIEGWSGARRPPRFDLIENVKRVFEMIRDLKKSKKQSRGSVHGH